MNKEQQREEQLSALLDSELDDQQLASFMRDLKRDPIADAESAQRYRLVGDVIRDEVDQSSFMDISAAVHRAIEQEPSHNEVIAPVNAQSTFSLSELVSSWIKPLTGMAVAASVAMVTLVTFSTVQSTDTREQPVQIAQQVVPVNAEIARNVQVASTLNTSKKSVQQQQQLNRYMLKHSGYASQSTMQGMMPYVRAADVNASTQEQNN